MRLNRLRIGQLIFVDEGLSHGGFVLSVCTERPGCHLENDDDDAEDGDDDEANDNGYGGYDKILMMSTPGWLL